MRTSIASLIAFAIIMMAAAGALTAEKVNGTTGGKCSPASFISSISSQKSSAIKTGLLDIDWERVNTAKDPKWIEDVAIPKAIKIIDQMDARKGIINLEIEDTATGDKESFEGNRWYAEGDGPIKEFFGDPKAPEQYYYKTLYGLVQLALTPDPSKPDYAQEFDYNSIIHVSSKSEAGVWKEKNFLTPVEVKAADVELADKLKGHTYVLGREIDSTKIDQPAIELGGVLYSFTSKYFSNDRASRISGFVPSDLYGPWGSFIDEFVDAALNAEMYRAKLDVAKMYDVLAERLKGSEKGAEKRKHKSFKEKFDLYRSEADSQKDVILKFLWNEEAGMVFNYSNHTHNHRTSYPSIGGAYAIWAGVFDVAKPDEVKMLKRMVEYISKELEGPDGYYASGVETGLALDKPNVRAIHQGMIVRGLKNYAKLFGESGMTNESKLFSDTADRVALKFLKAKVRERAKSKGKGNDNAILRQLYVNLTPDVQKAFESSNNCDY